FSLASTATLRNWLIVATVARPPSPLYPWVPLPATSYTYPGWGVTPGFSNSIRFAAAVPPTKKTLTSEPPEIFGKKTFPLASMADAPGLTSASQAGEPVRDELSATGPVPALLQ